MIIAVTESYCNISMSTINGDCAIIETTFCVDNIKNAILPTHYSR